MAVTTQPPGRSVPAPSGGRAGAVAMLPFIAAYAPFALVVGSTAATLDEPLAGWAGSWIVYGGSAQLAAMHGLVDGAAALAVATALLVNARLLVYGASMAPHWRHQPRWFRVVAPALLIDPTWAAAEERAREGVLDARAQRRFYLAAGLVLGTGWSAIVAVGAMAGDRLPAMGLELAAPLCFVAIVMPRLHEVSHRWAAGVGGTVAALTSSWPAGTGTAVAVLAGCVAAHVAAARRRVTEVVR